MTQVWQDIRFGFRMLVKTPVVSIVAALSLALGIAGATAVMAMASAFLFEPLPFGDQDSLVLLQQLRRGESIEMSAGVSMPNYRDLEAAATNLEAMTAFTTESMIVTGVEQPEQIQIVAGTPNLFDVLRVQPWLGRGFRPEEGVEGAAGVVVLTHAYWQRRFLGDPAALGSTLMLNGHAYTVVGVMPEEFEMLPANIEAFRPSDFTTSVDRASRGFLVFGRLRPGSTVEQVAAELTGTFSRLESEYPEANRNWTLNTMEARSWFPGPTDTRLVFLLLAVALFGLMIAGANVANLMLGRAETRMKEIAVRTALGAGRWRVLAQLLTESVLLALFAGGLGTFMGVYVIRGMRTAMPSMLPKAFWPALDVPTLIATVILAMLVGVLFGLAPALHASGANMRESLGEGSRGGTANRRRKRIRNFFVMGEVATALALLTGAGFLIQAMDTLFNQDPGFESAGLLTFQLSLPEYRYPDPTDLGRFETEALRTLAAIPGVEQVAIMNSLPRGRENSSTTFHVDGTPVVEPTELPRAGWQAVNPAYFQTLGIPTLSGRAITDEDRSDTRLVAVVNQEFADRYLTSGDPIGQRVELRDEMREIVGVVANIIQERVPLNGRSDALVYLPIEQVPLRNPAIALRVSGGGDYGAAIRRAISEIDADQPIAELRTLDDYIAESLAGPRVIGIFVLALGSLAMVLAAIGIYGVMSHNVVQARREIGIRMAIGARQGQVVGMVTRRGILLTGIGLLAGVPLALLIHRAVLNTLNLFDVELSSRYALSASAMLIVVSLLASYLPARRAARVAPTSALQD